MEKLEDIVLGRTYYLSKPTSPTHSTVDAYIIINNILYQPIEDNSPEDEPWTPCKNCECSPCKTSDSLFPRYCASFDAHTILYKVGKVTEVIIDGITSCKDIHRGIVDDNELYVPAIYSIVEDLSESCEGCDYKKCQPKNNNLDRFCESFYTTEEKYCLKHIGKITGMVMVKFPLNENNMVMVKFPLNENNEDTNPKQIRHHDYNNRRTKSHEQERSIH